MSVASNAEQRF